MVDFMLPASGAKYWLFTTIEGLAGRTPKQTAGERPAKTSGQANRTLYQTAIALGRRSGDIQRQLRQMHSEGLLVAEDDEPEPGTRFRLADGLEDALAEALRARIEMLVAIAANASEADLVRLHSVLEAEGVEVGSHRTAEVADGRRLRAIAVAAREAVAVAEGGEA